MSYDFFKIPSSVVRKKSAFAEMAQAICRASIFVEGDYAKREHSGILTNGASLMHGESV